jgi:hypothetical protein
VLADARAVAEAGAFAVVLEKVTEPLARRVTEVVRGDSTNRSLHALSKPDRSHATYTPS